jgi:malonyl-CoA/methylmalonyl-CoA synthetase
MNANLYALFEAHAADPAATCLVVPGGPTLSWADLAAHAARYANALTRAGCRPGDRVAAQVDKHWQVLPLYLACLRARLVYLPLNTGYRKEELAYFFGDATPRVVVCRPEALGVAATLSRDATVLTLDARGGELADRAAAEPDAFETVACGPDDLAAILYTSGTTGRSKGAMITHRNLASNALALVESWGFTRADTLLHALPIYHVHGLFVAIHCALLSACRMLWLSRFDPGEVAALLPKATAMMGVPTFYTRLLGLPSFTREACAPVRLFVSGSAPLLPETFRAFEARTGKRILERYGMTETGMIASNPLAGERRPGSVGRPLPGVEVRVVDDTGAACPSGAVGGVEVRGPNVFAGYWNMPGKTREAFTADGWFRTGDVGRIGDDGYLELVGRANDLVITGGLNVYPKEIEERIDAMAGVVESAVVGVPDPDLGEAVVAVVVATPGHRLTEAGVIAALKAGIAGFKVPKRVLFAAELPRNAMGKVQKNVLRENLAPPAGA